MVGACPLCNNYSDITIVMYKQHWKRINYRWLFIRFLEAHCMCATGYLCKLCVRSLLKIRPHWEGDIWYGKVMMSDADRLWSMDEKENAA